MSDPTIQAQAADYAPFITGSYVVAGLVLLWVLWRSISMLRDEKRKLERLK